MVTAAITRLRGQLVSAMVLVACLGIVMSSTAQANPRYAAIVVDVESGEVLHGANADETRYPASLTKVMTLYLLFEALERGELRLDSPLPVSAYAASKPASKLHVRAGSTIPVEKAIQALVIRSANDVAVVVAEALGGSEANFARMMTDRARELGMPRTTFRNANGLPDAGQTTTARDMATMSIRVMQDFPQYYHYFSQTRFTWNGQTITGHNRMLGNYPGADGLKTGFIRASGFNLATSAVRDGRRLVSVVMGGFTAASRDTHMADLLDRGFVRASLYGRGDWVAQADFSGDRMSGQGLPAAAPVAPSAPARQPELQLASLQAPEPLPTAEPSLPQTAQGSANDPIRDLLARSEPPATPRTETVHRLEPVGASASWGVQVGAFSNLDNARQHASRAADRLSQDLFNARVDIDEVRGAQAIFRARLVNLDENQAYRACSSLAREGIDCMVINAGL